MVMMEAARVSSSTRAFDSELVKAAVGASPDGIVWVDQSGTIVLVNDAARSMFGCSHVDCPITACAELFGIQTSEDAAISPAEIPLTRALIRRELVVDECCRIRRPGGVVDVLATATPLEDDEGRSVGATLVLRQIDKSDARNASGKGNVNDRASDARRFRALASATALLIWTTDPSGAATVDSSSWREFTGQTWEAYRGEGWLDAIHVEDRPRVRAAWFAAVESRSSYQIEYRMWRYDGVYRWTLAQGTPVLDERGEIVEWIGCNWDIHAIKEAERELARIVEFQQMLLAIVGHDLKNPLSAILLGARLLQVDASPSVQRVAERISRSALRANEIVQLLHDIAHAKVGKGLPMAREDVDIAQIAKEIIEEHDCTVRGRRAIVLSASGNTKAFADPTRVGQILSNLIGNALHHGKPTTDVLVTIRGDVDVVEIAVENAADEIPADRRERLFAPFCGPTTPPSGRCHLGLGLYIVKTIAEAHGGTVGVDSKEGWIVFRVGLPRQCVLGPNDPRSRRSEVAH
jgi:PAS domain S-box-containing protein